MKKQAKNPTINNRKARYNYEVLDTVEAGIALLGCEVKSIRDGKCDLSTSFATIRDCVVELHQFQIEQYPFHSYVYNPLRSKTLLLKKHEIRKLATQMQAKGLTLVPLKAYFNRGRLKVLLGLCRGKKNYDKRSAIKERDMKREQERWRK